MKHRYIPSLIKIQKVPNFEYLIQLLTPMKPFRNNFSWKQSKLNQTTLKLCLSIIINIVRYASETWILKEHRKLKLLILEK